MQLVFLIDRKERTAARACAKAAVGVNTGCVWVINIARMHKLAVLICIDLKLARTADEQVARFGLVNIITRVRAMRRVSCLFFSIWVR